MLITSSSPTSYGSREKQQVGEVKKPVNMPVNTK